MADFYKFLKPRSASDGDESEDGDRRHLRRSRRKRGGGTGKNRGAFDGDDEEAKKTRKDRHGMAPPNSTQFLLDDREARADAEHENEQKFEAAQRRRIRSMSGSCELWRPSWSSITVATSGAPTTSASGAAAADVDRVSSAASDDREDSVSSEESEADREMEREFETDYLEMKRERLQSMTRTQLAQELLERDYDTQLLAQELGSKDAENRHLRQLLSAHGIALEGSQRLANSGGGTVSSSTSANTESPLYMDNNTNASSPTVTAN